MRIISRAALKRAKTVKETVYRVVEIGCVIALTLWFIWSQNNLVIGKNLVFTAGNLPKTFVGYRISHVAGIEDSGIGVAARVESSKPDIILVSGRIGGGVGAKQVRKLSKIAPTYVLLEDEDRGLAGELGTVSVINGSSVNLTAPEVGYNEFIKKYIDGAIKETEEMKEYLAYTKEELEKDRGAVLKVSGIDRNDMEFVYDTIGSDKEVFQVGILGKPEWFEDVSAADIDLLFTGGKNGGMYANLGTTLFVSGGIGKVDGKKRFFNYPEVYNITLSDGTIKQENPLERLLGKLFPNVGTRFDGDEGFKAYKYKYVNGQEKKGNYSS